MKKTPRPARKARKARPTRKARPARKASTRSTLKRLLQIEDLRIWVAPGDEFVKALQGLTLDCRPDMHEPDEQGISATVTGERLDNAGVEGELVVTLRREGESYAREERFNLASLIALARLAELKSPKPSNASAYKPYTKSEAVRDYSWLGEVLDVQTAGPYTVVTYQAKYDKLIKYGSVVSGQRTNVSHNSFEGALAHAMAYRHEGPNSQASGYFERMLGL